MIELSHVFKSFQGVAAVDDLSLEIKPGEIFGLLGANGTGKSTSIHLLLGFHRADSGAVRIAGKEVSQHRKAVRSITGYIPENVNLYPYLSGLENLDYFCKLAGLKYSKDTLSAYLLSCGLQQEAHGQRVSGYSKGMRQKVGIAIAYAKQAKVYLLDEPASGLDPLSGNELSHLLKKLASDGAAILMASHDIFRVREVCQRIGILKAGKLVKELRSEEVSASGLEKVYLEFMQKH